MSTQEIKEGYSLNVEQEQDMMAKFFYSSIKSVYLKTPDRNKIQSIIVSTIEDYIAINPFKDVLPQTQDLFHRMPIAPRNSLDERFISISTYDFTSAMEDIKHIYFSALPIQTLQKYKKGIDLFFDRIIRFGCSEIMSASMEEVM